MLELLQSATVLKQLPRSGWLFAGVAQPESVADHSLVTAVLAMQMAARVNANLEANRLAVPLDLGRVVQIAVVHDLAECYITDLPRRATQLIGKSVKHEAEEKALAHLARDLPDLALLPLWREYSDLSSGEGRLVHDADKLEMMHQALVYERAGNRNLDEFWRGVEWHYQVSEEMYAALVAARDAGKLTGPKYSS